MPEDTQSAPSSQPSQQDLPSGCLVRLGWMAIGTVAMPALAMAIAHHRGSFLALSWADVAYGAVIVAMLTLRYVDIRFFQGCTAFGKPATVAHWRRYAVVLVAVGAALWALAHALACS